MTLIKSISGIRGTIGGAPGDNLTPLDLVRFTAAYARWLREGHPDVERLTVVIGCDARPSASMVSPIVEGTFAGCGVDVINLQMASTPTVEMAVPALGAHGGIIITASHNPREWNALKLLNAAGEFLSDADGRRVLAYADDLQSLLFAEVEQMGYAEPDYISTKRHIEAVLALDLVDVAAVRRAGYKVVVDGINSVGGLVIPELLNRMGVEVVELNCEPDGYFEHNPEPLPEHLTDLAELVLSSKADLGIAVDPDVDRLALVCEDGSMFGEEYTLVAVADYILSRTPGPTVSNLSSSRALRDVAARYGCDYHAAAVGEVNVVTRMKEVGAVIGGEGNGGVIYPALHYGRDALAGVALFLTRLALSREKASEWRASLPAYHISKNRIELTPAIDVDAILAHIKALYADYEVTDIDGVKIDFAEGWVHLRKSNTEPIIRIYSEGADQASAEALANTLINQIRTAAAL